MLYRHYLQSCWQIVFLNLFFSKEKKMKAKIIALFNLFKTRKNTLFMPKNIFKFERLTPNEDVSLDVYEEAINYAFENQDIKNIAISGAYGAGKSSILASYKKKHKDLGFLHISLAHFNSQNQEDETKVKESVLEGKILNQLIHQISPQKIPQTNFKIKRNVNSKIIIKRTAEIILLLVAITYFLCFDMWKNYISTLPCNLFKSFISLSTHPYGLMIDGVLIVIMLSLIIYELITVQKNKNIFRKLNLQGTEIEIFAENNDSYFDKYLNEVLYLFENVEEDAIVFEDMDRFDSNKIFERLREINTIANVRLQKENKKVLRFFYLLRDDIFISKDRTKFFDYIIPVVPVVDSSNSYDQFISHFKNAGLLEKFDENFLQGLSLYIDDMRILKNIYNEFIIYYNRLNTIELDYNKMLAIITYKNLFPCDFADLQLNQGFIYTIFSNKDKFILKEKEELNKQIRKNEQEIKLLKNNILRSINELNVIFAHKYFKNYNWHHFNDTDLQEFLFKNLNDENLNEYTNRKHQIESLLDNGLAEKINENFYLNRDVLDIENKKLHEIITRENIDEVFSITNTNGIGEVFNFNEIKKSEYFNLLKYLIRNGYIDETYTDYMSYFYENSISRTDKIFLRSIADKKAKEYTYKLKNPKLVVLRLKIVDFEQEEILNFDLLTYLLNTLSNKEYIEKFMIQLKITKNFKFISEFLDNPDLLNELPAFIKYLNIEWPELFMIAVKEKTLTELQIRNYSIYSLYYSDDSTLKYINKDNCLSEYISNARDYLSIEKPQIDRLIQCFNLLGVSFIGFDYEKTNKELFHAVYNDSLYTINLENLQIIQREILDIKNNKNILHKNYTILCSYPEEAITHYINENINEYFDTVFQMCNGNILDDEKVVISVLNNPELTIEHKHSYISLLHTTVTCINKIDDSSIWSSLLDVDIVQYSEKNIMDCFNVLKLNKSVVEYINRCNIILDFSKYECDNENKIKLFEAVTTCTSIKNPKYKQILVSLGRYYIDFTISDIANDKIYILIDTNIIRMTAATLEFMRENYPDLKFHFISKNIESYINIMCDELFSQDELLKILSWNINDKLKLKLLEYSDEEISITEEKYSNAVCLHILNNNFKESDLIDLFSTFEQWDNSIQSCIFDLAIKYIETIFSNHKCTSKKLINSLFHSNAINFSKKIGLLVSMMPDIDENYIKEILIILNLNEFLKIFDTKSRPKFEINDENEDLLIAFKRKKLIYDFEEIPDKEGYYKIIRNK